MTQNMEAEYSKFIGTPDENKTLECKIANDIQSGYIDIGENVRLIKGIFGDILLCFQSDIGLQRIRSGGSSTDWTNLVNGVCWPYVQRDKNR